jgi:uncharacterized protein YacL
MSIDFTFRIVGMVIFALIGGRLGLDASSVFGLTPEGTSFIFALVGMLFGLVLTPWITLRPVRALSRMVNEMQVEGLFTVLLGLFVGLLIALAAAYPLSLINGPLGDWLPSVILVVATYLCVSIFNVRSSEIWMLLGERARSPRASFINASGDRQLLVDTSVLIDGRIVEIAKTGFIGGTLLVPRFVLSELHQVADSSDSLRRNRGRRGLAKLNELQRDTEISVKIIEDDIETINEVDDKLIALAKQMDALVLTNDYNLNRVAEAQDVRVLNINVLANAVRSIYIPGESFSIHIIQEGRENGQGVGYLEDGTMVVVENGKAYMDRTIRVLVTKLINQPAGRMIFAVPENNR